MYDFSEVLFFSVRLLRRYLMMPVGGEVLSDPGCMESLGAEYLVVIVEILEILGYNRFCFLYVTVLWTSCCVTVYLR